jgi:glutamate synthase domain-containing protein 3
VWEEQLCSLLKMHSEETSSQKAEEILQNWDTEKTKFLQICPKEMLDKLPHPLSYESNSIPAE